MQVTNKKTNMSHLLVRVFQLLYQVIKSIPEKKSTSNKLFTTCEKINKYEYTSFFTTITCKRVYKKNIFIVKT